MSEAASRSAPARRPARQPEWGTEPSEGHAGGQLRQLRQRAGMSVEEVANRAAVAPDWLRRLEDGAGTTSVLYDEWVKLVRATQPPRPEWWDEGHEHDLHLPPGGHHEPRTPSERDYWDRIERVRSEIHQRYRHGRPVAN